MNQIRWQTDNALAIDHRLKAIASVLTDVYRQLALLDDHLIEKGAENKDIRFCWENYLVSLKHLIERTHDLSTNIRRADQLLSAVENHLKQVSSIDESCIGSSPAAAKARFTLNMFYPPANAISVRRETYENYFGCLHKELPSVDFQPYIVRAEPANTIAWEDIRFTE